MPTKQKSKPLTANQLVAANLRRIREQRGLTQEQAAERLEPYLGVRWSKATFSAAERSAAQGTRAREFTADELLAFARVFDLSVTWFFLPAEYEEDLPAVTCGGPKHLTPAEQVDAALPRLYETGELPRVRALARRLPNDDLLDDRIRARALARIDALTTSVTVRDVTEHAANLRRMANALEGADDKARELFAVAYAAEQGKENDA